MVLLLGRWKAEASVAPPAEADGAEKR